MNCDSFYSMRQWGERGSGRKIGIRVNPTVGVGRADNELLQYSDGRKTKFGISREQFAEALELAQWAAILTRHFQPRRLQIEAEPGDYLVKDAGLPLLAVDAEEKEQDTVFVGADAAGHIRLRMDQSVIRGKVPSVFRSVRVFATIVAID